MSNERKYMVAFMKQRVLRVKKNMLSCRAGSVEHKQAVIAYDRCILEMKHNMGILDEVFGRKA